MGLTAEKRQMVYKGEVETALATFFSEGNRRCTINIGKYTHRKAEEQTGVMTLSDLGAQGYHGLRIIRGELKTNGDTYTFFVKLADVGDAEGATHIQRNALCLVEASKFNIPTTPLSCYGLVEGRTYVLTESAGAPLDALLNEHKVPSDTILAAIANNIFGVSPKTIEHYLGHVPDSAKIYEQREIIRPNAEDSKQSFSGLFNKGINRLMNQTFGKYTAALQALEELDALALQKQDILQSSGKPTDDIKVLRDEIKAELSSAKNLLEEAKQLEQMLSQAPFPGDLPVVFLPTDLYQQAAEHIRIQKTMQGGVAKYQAMTLDSFLASEDESSAGSPREAIERLRRVAPILQQESSNPGIAQAGRLFEKLAEMITYEFFSEGATYKQWQQHDSTIQKIMDAWCASKNKKDVVDAKARELSARITQVFERASAPESERITYPMQYGGSA